MSKTIIGLGYKHIEEIFLSNGLSDAFLAWLWGHKRYS